jgi:hypothetical protein
MDTSIPLALELSCVRTGLENCQSKILPNIYEKIKNPESRITLAAVVYGTIEIGR